MKIKLYQLFNSIEALNVLRTCKMDTLKAYQLRKLYNEIKPEIDIIEEVRQELIKKHKLITKNGNYIVTSDFARDFSTLLDKEVELKELKKSMLNIEDIAENKLELKVLDELAWLIK